MALDGVECQNDRRRNIMIKPLYERVLLEKVEEKKETSSGILLGDTSKESSLMAKVLAKGDGKLNDEGQYIALPVNEGDIVIYKEYAATEIKYEGKEYLLIDMKDILAIVKEA